MNNKEILRIAKVQSAIDMSCNIVDFDSGRNKVVVSSSSKKSKSNFRDKAFCTFASYGNGLVASVDESIERYVTEFLNQENSFRYFELPKMKKLNSELRKHGKIMTYMTQYFLPDISCEISVNSDLQMTVFDEVTIEKLYDDERFSMALEYDNSSEKRDILAIGGYLNGVLVGVAGASNDSEKMWQIGIDVLPEYRGENIASTLTQKITRTVLSKGIVPYCSIAWSNIASLRTAQSSGYKLSWVEISAASIDECDGFAE